MDDWIDIAVFGEGKDGEGGGPVLFLERRRLRASSVAFEVVVDHRPAWVAIDPYYKLIDRDRDDNVSRVDQVEPFSRRRAIRRPGSGKR